LFFKNPSLPDSPIILTFLVLDMNPEAFKEKHGRYFYEYAEKKRKKKNKYIL